MDLLPFFNWMEALPFSVAIRNSAYLGAAVNVAHLLSLVMFAGAVLIVDLRLLGGGMKKQPLAQVAQDARPFLTGGLLALLVTGIPQLTSTAIKQYYSPFFWFKMELLVVAVIFTFTVRQKVTQANEARLGPIWGKLVGLASIAMWTGIAIPARLIGLLG